MLETTSPIDNPDRKWKLLDLSYFSFRVQGINKLLRINKIKDRFWVGDMEYYHLDAPKETLLGSDLIVCYVFKAFGREAAIQNWGFYDEMEGGGGKQAVRFNGKWFLMEKDEMLEINTVELVPPFTAIRLSLHNSNGIMTSVYKKPPV